MRLEETGFKDLFVIHPDVYMDDRGYFFESFNVRDWKNSGLPGEFVQDNESLSKYGTIRGLHYQVEPFAQAKLVRVSYGSVRDVVVDLRKEEDTFGQHYSIDLSSENKKQLYIPKGFAHAFLCKSQYVIFSYKCDGYYSKSHEAGINPLDRNLGIDWGIDKKEIILSDKDRNAPLWGEHKAI